MTRDPLYLLVVVLGEAVIIGMLLRLVRTFARYTDAVRDAHHTNIIVHTQTLEILREYNAARARDQVPDRDLPKERSA